MHVKSILHEFGTCKIDIRYYLAAKIDFMGFPILAAPDLQTIHSHVMLVLLEGGLAIALADMVELTDTWLNFYGRKVFLPHGQHHTPTASNAIIIAIAVLPKTVAANLVGRRFKFPITAIGFRHRHC